MLLRFLTDETGATAIEYGLIVAFVSMAILTGFSQVSDELKDIFIKPANVIDQAGKPEE